MTSRVQPPTQPTVMGRSLPACLRSLRTSSTFSSVFRVAASPLVPAKTTRTGQRQSLKPFMPKSTSGDAALNQKVEVLLLDIPINVLSCIVAEPCERWHVDAEGIRSGSFCCRCGLSDHLELWILWRNINTAVKTSPRRTCLELAFICRVSWNTRAYPSTRWVNSIPSSPCASSARTVGSRVCRPTARDYLIWTLRSQTQCQITKWGNFGDLSHVASVTWLKIIHG